MLQVLFELCQFLYRSENDTKILIIAITNRHTLDMIVIYLITYLISQHARLHT